MRPVPSVPFIFGHTMIGPYHHLIPGQFLTFEVQPKESKKPVLRCYSLSEQPLNDYYRVTIRKVPDGLSSTYFHDEIQEGDYLNVRAPAGVFHIDLEDYAPIVMLAGGVGITPFLSMFHAIAEQTPGREAWLIYSARTASDLVLAKELERLAGLGRNLHVHFTLNEKSDGDKALRNVHYEMVTPQLLDRLLPSVNYDFYMCGPPPMMVALEKGLKEWGVKKQHIHYENFSPPAAPKEIGKKVQVTFKKIKQDL